MVRRKNDSDMAVMEPPARPEDIAARVAQADIEARKASAVADIEQWRQIVTDIADGTEPDGKALAAIGDLARRLRLPPDAVGQSVKAIQADRRHQAEIIRARDAIVDIKQREPLLTAELKQVERRLAELRSELAGYAGTHTAYPFAVQAANATRQENPLLFAEVENVAQKLVAAESGMSSEMFKSMVPQRARLEGHYTSTGAWHQ